jgi:hypothetical protein
MSLTCRKEKKRVRLLRLKNIGKEGRQMKRTISVLIILFLGSIVYLQAQPVKITISFPTDSTKKAITVDAAYELTGLMDRYNVQDRRLVYYLVTGFDDVRGIALTNYETETDPVCKRLIALIGYSEHPTSLKWKKRFLDTFPHSQQERDETFGNASTGENTNLGADVTDLQLAYVSCLSFANAKDDKRALLCLFEIDGTMDVCASEEVDEVTSNIADASPRFFLKQLNQLSKENRDIVLDSVGGGMVMSGDTSLNRPFTKELQLLIKNKDKELGTLADYSLKYIKKIIEENKD